MSRTSLAILIELANRDGKVDESEKKLIYKIGQAHNHTEEEIAELIENTPANIDYDHLTDDERFEMLYDLVRLMKADGKVFDTEILYCLEVAKKLHYPMEAVMELYGLVHTNLKLSSEIKKVQRKFQNIKKED